MHSGDDDRRRDVGFDEQALYRVVENAVEDALLNVVGTLLLVGIAFVAVGTGAQIAITSISTAGLAVGIAVAGFGLYLAAATLELVPPIREWR